MKNTPRPSNLELVQKHFHANQKNVVYKVRRKHAVCIFISHFLYFIFQKIYQLFSVHIRNNRNSGINLHSPVSFSPCHDYYLQCCY